jgi:hypothetical protein
MQYFLANSVVVVDDICRAGSALSRAAGVEMAFTAECPFCRLMLREVPETRLGGSADCPRCRCSFTLAPMSAPAAVPGRGPRLAARKPVVATVPAAQAPPVELAPPPSVRTAPAPATHPEGRIAAAATEEPPAPPEELLPEEEQVPAPPKPRLPTVLGQIAFCLGSLAVVSAAIPRLGILTIVLAGLGLLIGVGGVVAAAAAERGFIFPIVGLCLCVPVVGVMLIWPSLLGLAPLWRKDNRSVYTGQSVVSLGGKGGSKPLADGESPWVDASRDAIRMGDVRIRVRSATVKMADFVEWKDGKVPKEFYLVIELRISNVGLSRSVDYLSWYRADGPAPALTDNQGKSYRVKHFESGRKVKGHVASASIPTQKFVDDVLIFEAPAAGVEYLRLEIPASAFGADGVVRLEIPKEMIAYR